MVGLLIFSSIENRAISSLRGASNVRELVYFLTIFSFASQSNPRITPNIFKARNSSVAVGTELF
jgi:hypothetical protein